ncbi:ferrous iron transport protein B [Phosphitispora fastidiosa]|uniref:ferrous iron transport protein B n=1 Tax=Phosphitispora fastidiosa TaxID=2837202 RepID=UPI001E5F8070|nr:ferrous iron transport protein B [Phosphitispora fastidiosa]MBU7007005.1 ferrous iron transport protein B [Phosphitispora fastidiosa]
MMADHFVVALAGNPNVGKSTIFNSLTGLNQHTGNWPGKTVANARGKYRHKDKSFILVDIPGTYSLMASSVEETVARDFICFGEPDVTVVVADATCLERNLNLVLQTLEITGNVVVCVNLLDEAERKEIKIDLKVLQARLGVPVVGVSARSGRGLNQLMETVYRAALPGNVSRPLAVDYEGVIEEAVRMVEPEVRRTVQNKINSRWAALKLVEGDHSIIKSLRDIMGFDLINDAILANRLATARKFLQENNCDSDVMRDSIVSTIVSLAEEIAREAVISENQKFNSRDRKIDSILTSRRYGLPAMITLLGLVFWLTVTGANYPSEVIAGFLFWIEERLTEFFQWAGSPPWLHGLLVEGMYRTLAWVVSVMLPPMAIFFPLFTILEDLGYLPRVAFNMDNFFKKAHAHGKQALTMCMGFGCNAAGIIGCRIIDSPRERLIATITNNFVPCNGRFPALIAISTIFVGGTVPGIPNSVVSTCVLMSVIILGVFMTLLISRILSATILKGLPSSFILELPPYRKPQIGRILVRSVFDRTLFVLGRAACIAAPAGMAIWVMANITIGGVSLLGHGAGFLQPFALLLGLDGYILMAFILGFPANEIVIPIIIMSYVSTGSLVELDSLEALRQLLISHGWTWLTAVCVMLFSLMHFPCGTTLWTIKKETQSWKWTLISFLVPTLTGITVCFIVAQTVRMLGLG